MTRPSGTLATWAYSIAAIAVAGVGHLLMRAVLPGGAGQYLSFLIVGTIASVRWGRRSAGAVLAVGLAVIVARLTLGGEAYGTSPLGIAVAILGYITLSVLIVYTGHSARSHARASEHARAELERSLAAAEVGSWHFDFERKTLEYSPSVGPLIGRPVGFTHASIAEWLSEVHPDDCPGVEQRLRDLRDGEGFEQQYRLRTPSGEWRWLLARGRLERSADGRLRRVDGIIMNMTSARAVELDRWRSREELRTMLDLIPAGVAIAHDRSGQNITVSPRFARLLGISTQQNASFTGPDRTSMPVRCIRRGVQVDPDDLPMQVAARTGREVHDYDVDFVFEDGRVVHLLIGAVPLYDTDGTVRGAIGVHTDITALKLAQAELERADRQKDIFLATLAHELRNPLAPIRYAAASLRDAGSLNAGIVADAARLIERQSSQMAQLLDELLDMSRIARDVVELRRETVDLARIVRREVDALRPRLNESARGLNVVCDGPMWVHGDETRLHQVVSNLLSNAIKYTRTGGQIVVQLEPRGADEIALAVRDNGIGIAAADLPHVFDLFSQVRDPRQASVGGLGIGLAVVRRLVELHGGRTAAASPGLGAGATFTVLLPRVEAPALKSAVDSVITNVVDVECGGGRRVLVVDDNIDAADSLSMLLRAQGFAVQVAHDGRGALRAAEEFRPEVAVLDLGLPDLPGEEVAVALRMRPWGHDVQLVAVTGWGQPKDRARTTAAGFEHHLVKPVEPAQLIEVLNAKRARTVESASA